MFSIVIPVYQNEASIQALLGKLDAMRAKLKGPLEVVFVVDGSPDQCFEKLRLTLPSCTFRSQVLAHSRNFGSLAAIRTGLQAAHGEYFAVMAADLQEPPELVEQFFELLQTREVDVVVGQRASRSDPATSSAAAQIFWWLYRKTINPDIPPGGVDIFGCNLLALQALLRLNESNSSMIAQLFWVGFRRRIVPYERLARSEGVSAWTFRKKIRYLLDSVYSFTDLPIRLLSMIGVVAILTAFGLGLAVLASRLTDHIQLPGYTPTILTIVFFGGINALGLGIIGEYVWRAFENTKARPSALVLTKLSFEPTGHSQPLSSGDALS